MFIYIGCPLDVVFVIDASDSVRSGEFDLVKDFVKVEIARYESSGVDYAVGVIVFSNSVSDVINLAERSGTDDLFAEIDQLMRPADGTRLHTGLESMRLEFTANAREGSDRVGIIISDGLSQEMDLVDIETNATKSEGIILVTLGIGSEMDVDSAKLEEIASNPSYKFGAPSYAELQSTVIDWVPECPGKVFLLLQLCALISQQIHTLHGSTTTDRTSFILRRNKSPECSDGFP